MPAQIPAHREPRWTRPQSLLGRVSGRPSMRGSRASVIAKDNDVTVRVRDLMAAKLITCPPNTTLGAAAAMLARQHVHALVVIDRAGMQQGVVSDVDLLAAEWLSRHPDDEAGLRNM